VKKRPAIKIGADEEIIAYEHHIGSHVELLAAHGDKSSNELTKFILIASQDHQELMDEHLKNKPKGQFRKDDLWKFVDHARGVS